MKKEIPVIIISIALAFLFHWKLFLPLSIYTSQDYGRGDLTHFNYPMKDILSKSLKSGSLPLWTDKIYGGFPPVGESQIGAFYLPNLILFFFLPTYLAFNLSYILVHVFSLLGIYYYCRFLKLSSISSFTAGVAFSFSMYFIGHAIHLNLIQAASLIPFTVLFGERLLRKASFANFAVLSILISQQIFAGHMQISVYTLITLGLIAIFRLITKETNFKNLLILYSSFFVSILLSSVQLFPTYEFFKVNIRSANLPTEYITLFPYNLKHLLMFINPFVFGDPSKATFSINPKDGIFWENIAYVGIIPLVFGLIALLKIKREKSILLNIILLTVTLVFSLGWLKFLFFIPPLSTFRVHQKSLIIASFSLVVLSAYGFEFVKTFLVSKFHEAPLADASDIFSARFAGAKSAEAENSSHSSTDLRPRFSAKADKYKLPINILLAIVSLLVFANLYWIGSEYNGGLGKEKWLETPETANFVKNDIGTDRIFSVGQNKNWFRVYQDISKGWRSQSSEKLLSTRAVLDPNTNIVWNIASLDGYAAARSQNAELLNSLIKQGVKEEDAKITINSIAIKLLSMNGVKYIISTKEITNENLEKKTDISDPKTNSSYKIYLNKANQGRIYSIEKIAAFTKVEDLVNILAGSFFDPRYYALVGGRMQTKNFSKKVDITQIRFSERKIEFDVESKEDAFVVVADSFYPGWIAKIDADETNILPVNINSRGVITPPGKHKVEIEYKPNSFRVGFVVSMLTLAGILTFPFAKRKIISRLKNLL